MVSAHFYWFDLTTYEQFAGKFRREFLNVFEKCKCAQHEFHSHSLYLNAPVARMNTVSPNSRSIYQVTSLRDRASFREKKVNFISLFLGKYQRRNIINLLSFSNHSD